MKPISTKARLKGKAFRCHRLAKGLAIEAIGLLRQKCLESAVKQGGELEESERAFRLPNGQDYFKPIHHRFEPGILECGPEYAVFNDKTWFSYREVKNLKDSRFETDNAVYILLREVKKQ